MADLRPTPRSPDLDPIAAQHRGRAGALGLALLGGAVLTAGPAGAAKGDRSADDRAIRDLISAMQDAWNRGDFRGYMAGFLNPGVIFVSKGRIKTGWQDTLDHYVADYGAPERRGVLAFSDIRIEFLAPDAAQLISHYRLERPVDLQDGINTRLMRKVDGRWLIALNHVSARETDPPTCRQPG
jgi:uncharacterized protein (TIGR02246 family)